MDTTHSNPENGAPDETPSKVLSRDMITLPRWIVYFQGGLLGVIAATFFVFGLMVGNLTSGDNRESIRNDCRVTGKVFAGQDDRKEPDEGAVVVCFPKDATVMERVNPASLNPTRFEPLNNGAIDLVHEIGGAVVSINSRGEFDVIVDASRDYYLLVISKSRMQVEKQPLTKAQKAAIGTLFMPIENLIGEHAFHWSDFTADSERADLGTIEF